MWPRVPPFILLWQKHVSCHALVMLVLCHELNQHFAGTTKGAGHHYCIVYYTIVIILWNELVCSNTIETVAGQKNLQRHEFQSNTISQIHE
jgi:hypothetical protein